ncbi:bifunctional glycogen debranching protein GlgX/4-alpha-glucanotransferase|uniref:4-alpha-glucanotransferase n=1 Tax=Dendrosporobacter quercicolus TaxID=146817 RepID=A0A1G9Q5H3_9FIRM|nr:bifunctional glycogen debranching protein GlgX/4-alpha-glucanotransferase [Dendrosporobacter quercicolus]NSL48126.1 bifunctional glycogen debranching protein GlgX/4-alpha-glucanotransferase [Dendrosporobacter quercicolus DSM 1736]SDM06268.1 4-alpha-glucanotransferase [Dendrosporobacter quercicolus]
MNQSWLFHNSHSLDFRSPFGAVCCDSQIRLKLQVLAPGRPESVTLRLWEDDAGEQKVVMRPASAGLPNTVYQTKITAPRSGGILWYYFIVVVGGQTFYYGNNRAQLGGAGEIYHYPPPSFQITVYRQGTVTPAWFKEAVMYQIFPDRFCNGLTGQQPPALKKESVVHSHWSNTPYYIRDVDTKEIVAYDFFGGNLAGIIAKLPYLAELGINVIYLNPVFEAASNHRYDTGDYHKIDPLLGDNELFAELCASAGKLGIAVLLDGVFSHTGSDSRYFNKYGNYPGPGAYQSVQSPFYPWYRFTEFPDKYESWWGIDTLPNVEENEPSYTDFIINDENSVLHYWLKRGIKGWRLDVVDELPEKFVQGFAKAMKAADPDAVLIGEVWEDASHKVSYGVLRKYLCGDELDSVMNYPFRQILLDFMLGRTDARMTQRLLMSLYENYPRQHFYALMNLLGSHDVERVLTLLGEAPASESLSITQQARSRLTEAQRILAVKRLKLLVVWQMTFPGVPCVYYGDEAGLEGYKDPFNRRTYPWGGEDRELLEWHQRLIALRHRYPVFKTGEWLPLYAEGDIYGYVRQIINGRDCFGEERADNTALILINRNKEVGAELILNVRGVCRGLLRDLLSGREITVRQGSLAVELAPLEAKLLLQVEQSTLPRQCGLLCHPTSLPSKYGIGDMGKEAYEFVNFLYKSKQKLWQVLPLNPVGYGESPYQGLSAFAGNHLLISLGKLVAEGLLSAADVKTPQVFAEDKVEFAAVAAFKEQCLRRAFANFKQQSIPGDYRDFAAGQASWLDDYALFMAIKQQLGGLPWTEWPAEIAARRPEALMEYRQLLQEEIAYQLFIQYVFFKQWLALKRYANQWGIQIIGDMPIFVAHDSADVWANQHLFQLDRTGLPQMVAGVPPDYFSETGQLWGNPQYHWPEMARENYRWWRDRFTVLLQLVDIIRVDHFRGFEAYWEIPAGEQTAVNGRWVKGPGSNFFASLEQQLGKLPIIAEDLGLITPEVEDLKNEFHYPGMKVLHFALVCDESGCCAPFICEKNSVVYTGTHDNDTTLGWYKTEVGADADYAACINQMLHLENTGPEEICWNMIDFAYASNANTVIIPLQDALCLDSDARMNIPGTVGGNWQWRCRKEYLTPGLAARLAALAGRHKR